MAERLHRTQILLEPEQHRELAGIAKKEVRSVSDLVREMVQKELERQKATQKADIERRLAGLEKIRQFREKILRERNGEPIDFDVVEAIHKSWEEQDERNWSILTDSGD